MQRRSLLFSCCQESKLSWRGAALLFSPFWLHGGGRLHREGGVPIVWFMDRENFVKILLTAMVGYSLGNVRSRELLSGGYRQLVPRHTGLIG
jgi:hypothetical protein